jgi:pyruvate,water dikinase
MIKAAQEISEQDYVNVGGKVKGLLLLKTLNFKVPEFSIIDSQTIEQWLNRVSKDHSLKDIIVNDLKGVDNYFFDNVAVRSAVLGEDSEAHSFAGIHQTVLEVKTKEEAVEAIIKVIESAFSKLAMSYRIKNNLATEGIKISIVIQKMVIPKISGVAFGIDMQTGCRRSSWISMTEGLGEKLVSGAVSGQEFIYKNQTIIPITNDKISEQHKNILSEVGHAVLRVSEVQKTVMDIEWCHDGQHCWYVQARPVTALPADKNLKQTVFDNSNIQESYCGVTTPLTFSYASIAYSKVYAQLMRLMLIPEKEIQGFSGNLSNMLGLVSGRVYYNINSWYAGLLYLPSFGKRKKEMEDMMGLEKPVDFVVEQQFSFLEKLKKTPQMIQLMFVMGFRFYKMKSLVREFDQWFNRIYSSAQIDKIYQLKEYEIIENIKKYQDLFLEKWGIPVLNDTKVMMDMGKVKRKLEQYGFTGELKSLIYGTEIESIKPTLEIHKLAKLFASDESLLNILAKLKGNELMEALMCLHKSAYDRVKDYISNYGDRCMGELKLETITMRQDPEMLFILIRNFIKADLHHKEHLFSSHNEKDLLNTFKEVTQKMHFLEKKFFEKNIFNLKTSIANRELMRLHRTKNFGLMREYFLALGRCWQKRNFLTQQRDIFYLTQEEIFQISDGRFYGNEIKKLVELRKNNFLEFKESKVATQMKAQFPNSLSSFTIVNDIIGKSDALSGLSCSQGEVEGEVVVVNSPEDIVDLNGKILVAERTDPGWTPLFALIKGVIIEKGSMLSHSAVIAREMGIPAVLGIQDITKILKTGDVVRLDGTNGNIRIINIREEIPNHRSL